MTTTRALTIGIVFTDASKRNLTFSPLAVLGNDEDAMASNFKTRIKNVKNENLSGITIDGETASSLVWQNYLVSKDGAPASGINDATYTVTEVTNVYDSTTYEP